MSFKSQSCLTKHSSIHNKHKFENCGTIFWTKQHLEEHLVEYHSVESYACQKCQEKFMEKLHLEEHIELNHSKKNNEGTLCNESVSEMKNLKRHIESVHNQEKQYKIHARNVITFL